MKKQSPFYKTGVSRSPFNTDNGKQTMRAFRESVSESGPTVKDQIINRHFKAEKSKVDLSLQPSGTTSFPTTESRESKYTLKQLGGMAADVAMSVLPVGRIKSAISAGKALSKVPSYLSKLNKKFPSGSNTMGKHYNKVSEGIKQIKNN